MNNKRKRHHVQWYECEFEYIRTAVHEGLQSNRAIMDSFLKVYPGRTENSVLAATRNYRKDRREPATMITNASDEEFKRALKARVKRYKAYLAGQEEPPNDTSDFSDKFETAELTELTQEEKVIKVTITFTGHTLTSVVKWVSRNLTV